MTPPRFHAEKTNPANSILAEGTLRGLLELATGSARRMTMVGPGAEAFFLGGTLGVRWVNDASTGLTWFICRDRLDGNRTAGGFLINRQALVNAKPLCEASRRSHEIERYAIQFALEGPRISYPRGGMAA